MRPKIVPELYCSDFARSLRYYRDVLGFSVRYDRPEERFASLEREGAELMIEQTVELPRTFLADEARYPFGRGVNLQIEVSEVDILYTRVLAAESRIYLPIEERWYRIGNDVEGGNRQFVVMDPDGYLLRFWQDIGQRTIQNEK
jgi:catechol 2,3-dioxygenase-like lactoylglutathione lyase family enzyme